jgi:hypothetical protein
MTINYELPFTSHVKLTIYDVMGRKVRMLVDTVQNKGSYNVTFDTQNLPGGTYFYELATERQKQSRKMTLIR